jgi:hypothetical protein
MNVTIKTTITTTEDSDVVCWKIADGLSDLLASLDFEVGPRGITCKVTEPGSVVHLDVKEAA